MDLVSDPSGPAEPGSLIRSVCAEACSVDRTHRSMQMYWPVSMAAAGCSHSRSLSLLKRELRSNNRTETTPLEPIRTNPNIQRHASQTPSKQNVSESDVSTSVRFPWLPVGDRLLQVLALQEAVPEQVVSGALGGRVVVDGRVREQRTGEPTGLSLQDGDRSPAGLPPVKTHRF